jgi:hypothetical protein
MRPPSLFAVNVVKNKPSHIQAGTDYHCIVRHAALKFHATVVYCEQVHQHTSKMPKKCDLSYFYNIRPMLSLRNPQRNELNEVIRKWRQKIDV